MADSPQPPKPGQIVNPEAATPAPADPSPSPAADPPVSNVPPQDGPARPNLGQWLTRHWQVPAIVVAALVLAVGGFFGYKLAHKTKPAPAKVAAPAPPPPPAPPPVSLLTGAQVDPSILTKPITAVVIENHPDARPQSGLSQAGVVYEALAEGGITRFEAFFDSMPATLGPVRSLRTYFVSWGLEFDAPVAHAGGNTDALDLVPKLGLKDMNEFTFGSSFYRTKDRFAPHNLYTSGDLLTRLEQGLHVFGPPNNFKPSPRKPDSPEATPSHLTIDINYSYNGFQVEYRYDKNSNSYQRFLAGAPHIDRNTNQQIMVKNVVVEYMPTAFGTTRIGEQTVRMGDSGLPIGRGKAIVFRDGGAVEATWVKPDNRDRTQLVDTSGKDIPLDVGNTWYSIVPTDHPVKY